MKSANKNKKMTLTDYYQSLQKVPQPKTTFAGEVMRRCGVTITTVQTWVNKGQMPDSKEHCDIIAEIVGRPATELFPNYNDKFSNTQTDDQAR